MEWITEAGHWIRDNEALLSGLVALVVLVGLILSPLGSAVRRLFGNSKNAVPIAASFTNTALEESDAPTSEDFDSRPQSAVGPSIAVLPFDNLSDDREQSHLADGMTEDIITGLAATPHLNVIARNSSFAYKGQSPDIRKVGRDLGVRYVLEGSVRRVSSNMRVTVQLIDADTGNHLWANKYDKPYSEIFEAQDEVVSDITGALSLQITQAEVARARTGPPTQLELWELVTQTLHSHFRHAVTLEANREVLDTLRKAVELDENYGYARAAYAWMLASSAINGWVVNHMETLQEAVSQLRAALELDVSDSLSQYYIGAANMYLGNSEKSVRYLEYSLEQNPHQPDAMAHLGLARGYCRKFELAYACFDSADRIGISESRKGFYAWYRGIVLALEDRHEEAIPFISAVVENFPTYQTPKVALAISLEMTGKPDKARALIERAYAMEPALNLEGLALIIAAHFDPDKGRQREAVLRKYWPG